MSDLIWGLTQELRRTGWRCSKILIRAASTKKRRFARHRRARWQQTPSASPGSSSSTRALCSGEAEDGLCLPHPPALGKAPGVTGTPKTCHRSVPLLRRIYPTKAHGARLLGSPAARLLRSGLNQKAQKFPFCVARHVKARGDQPAGLFTRMRQVPKSFCAWDNVWRMRLSVAGLGVDGEKLGPSCPVPALCRGHFWD